MLSSIPYLHLAWCCLAWEGFWWRQEEGSESLLIPIPAASLCLLVTVGNPFRELDQERKAKGREGRGLPWLPQMPSGYGDSSYGSFSVQMHLWMLLWVTWEFPTVPGAVAMQFSSWLLLMSVLGPLPWHCIQQSTPDSVLPDSTPRKAPKFTLDWLSPL